MSNKISIETAYNVEFEYNLSNIWDRVWAFLIDSLIKIGYLILIFLVFGRIVDDFPWILIALSLPWLFYSLAFEILNNGQTPGKKAMNIQVVSLDGRNLTSGQLLNRWMLRFIDFLMFSTSIAFLAVTSTRKSQRLGDMAANTTVISLKDKTSVSKTSKVKLPDGFEGKYPQTTKLKDEEVELIKQVIRDRTESGSKLRLAMAEKLSDYLGIPKEEKSKDYLKQVVYNYNYFIMLEEGQITPPKSSSIYSSEEE